MEYERKDIAARGVRNDAKAPRPIFPKLSPEGVSPVLEGERRKSEFAGGVKRAEVIAQDSPEEQTERAVRKPIFTDEELRLGFKMGVILGEPVSRRMMPRKQKRRYTVN